MKLHGQDSLEKHEPLKGESCPSAGQGTIAPEAFRGTYFVCIDCDYVFTVSESVYASKAFKTDCPQCDRPISIERVLVREDMEIVELLGCEYSSKPTGKLGVRRAPRSKNPQLSPQAKFLEEFEESKWIVEGRRGKQFTFQYCSALRNAIVRKEMRGKDIVISPDGSRFRLDQYPGTADLFGNADKFKEARKYLDNRPKVSPQVGQKLFHLLSELALFVVAGAALAFLLLNGPEIWSNWRYQQEQAWLTTAVLKNAQPLKEDFAGIIQRSQKAVDQDDPAVINAGIQGFMNVLAVDPKNMTALSGITKAWAKRGILSSSTQDLVNAKKAVDYMKRLNPEHPDLVRAETERLWLTQGPEKALAFLEQETLGQNSDLSTRILLAKLALAAKDHGRATIHLYEALTMDPTNITLLETFVRLFKEQEKWDEAAGYLRKLIDQSASPETYRRELASLHEVRGDLEAAKRIYVDLTQKSSGREQDHLKLAQILKNQHEHEQVMRHAQAYFDMFPEGDRETEMRSLYEAAVASLNAQIAEDEARIAKKNSVRSVRRRRSSRR